MNVALLVVDLDGTVRHGGPGEPFVTGADDVVVYPEAARAMRLWRERGGRVIGVTNQGGIALGFVTVAQVAEGLDETGRQLRELAPSDLGAPWDEVGVCAHHPAADNPEKARCWCRKPSPGLIIEIAARLHVLHPGEHYPPHLGLMVGDQQNDFDCARLAGFDFVWADQWRDAAPPERLPDTEARIVRELPDLLD